MAEQVADESPRSWPIGPGVDRGADRCEPIAV